MTRWRPAGHRATPRCQARDRLDRAMDLMVEHQSEQVVVVGRDGHFVGVLSAQDALKVAHLLGAERAARLRVANALRLVLSRQGSGVRPRPVAPDDDAPFPLVRPRAETDAEPLPLVTLRPSASRDIRPRADDGDGADPLMRAFLALGQLPWSKTPAEALGFATRLLFELVPSEAGFGYVYDVDRDVLRVITRCGEAADVQEGDSVPRAAGLFAHAARHLCPPLRVAGVRGHRAFDPRVDALGPDPRTALYMPLEHDGTLLGLLHLVNRRDAPSFGEDDGAVAAYVGQQLADYLYGATLAVPPAGSETP